MDNVDRHDDESEFFRMLAELEASGSQPTIPPIPARKFHRPRLNLNGRKRGNILYMTRACRGLTQQQLAVAAGVSVRTINDIESYRSSPSVHTAMAIAQALGTQVEDIFTLRKSS